MNRHSPLPLIILLVVTMLGHSAHNVIASPQAVTSADSGASTASMSHLHSQLESLRIVDHGALTEISPEICTVANQAAPSALSGAALTALLAPDTRDDAAPPSTGPVPLYDAPVFPPDVRRALLQVFLI